MSLPCCFLKLIAAVVRFLRGPIFENDQRSHDVSALEVRNIGALDAERRLCHAQVFLDCFDGSATGCEVPGSPQFVLVEGLGSITNDGVHEGSFVTTLRNANVNVRTPQPRQILTDLRDVLGLLHNQDLTRYRLSNVVENPGALNSCRLFYGLLSALDFIAVVLQQKLTDERANGIL